LVHQSRLRWVYFLPILHVCACVTSLALYMSPIRELQHLGILWTFIMMADLPVSIVAYVLAWQHGALAAIWVIVAGSLWWYLLSRGVEVALNRFLHRPKLG
jgi:hypothetical protein